MLKFIHADTPEHGIKALADRICATLKEGKNVLWLVSGGSNIPIAVEAMNMVRRDFSDKANHSGSVDSNSKLSNLIVALTDERYGPVGHKDSNWKQLEDSRFDFEGISKIPVLINKSLEEMVSAYEKAIGKAMNETLSSGGSIIGQFGIGADGHIAGILPHSPAASYGGDLKSCHSSSDDSPLVCGYESDPFTRITLTPAALKRASVAYVFAFGDSKKEALKSLRGQDLPINEQPAQILKQLPEASIFCDI